MLNPDQTGKKTNKNELSTVIGNPVLAMCLLRRMAAFEFGTSYGNTDAMYRQYEVIAISLFKELLV